MHPIERLRFVARAEGADDRLLAVEATAALMTFADHPAALVAGCRRILARQPCCGPLWWACARMLTAEDLWATAHETISMLEDDPTDAALSYALGEPVTAGDRSLVADPPVQVVRARAVGGGMALLDTWDTWDAPLTDPGPQCARWLVAGVGTRLCDPMWDALVRAATGPAGRGMDPPITDLSAFTHVVGVHGPVPLVAMDEPDCPVAPELFTLEG